MFRESLSEKIVGWAILVFLIIFSFIIIYPVILIVSSSFSNPSAVMAQKVVLFPVEPTLTSYKMVFKNPDLLRSYMNTIIYTFFGTGINLIFTAIAAYPLSRKDLFGGKWVTSIIVFTMFFSGGMIPSYFVVKDLHLINSMWALILPGAISTYNMIIVRTFFQSIPVELQEAAFIDGANDIYIFAKVILPLSKPVMAVMVLYYGVGHWNSWFSAILYLSERSKYPLTLILREILIQVRAAANADDVSTMDREQISEGIKYATMVVAILPIICLYPFLQKHFAKGVMIGALKG